MGRAHASRSPTLVHADFDYPMAVISLSVAVLGIGIAAYFWFQREELGRAQGPHRSATSSRTPGYTFLVNKYYLDDLYEDVIVAGDQGPDRPRPRTGSTST